MAVQAGLAKEACAGTCSTKRVISVPSGADMTGTFMTILAEAGDFLFNQTIGLGAVGVVADCTIFLYWRVFPYKRTTFFGVAFVAKLVGVFCVNHVL